MAARRLLISYAHPDDESFGNGGLIAKYVAEGVEVYLICATDGDMGTIPDEMKNLYSTVRELRLSELEAANKVLGFKKIFTLGFKDSGMMTDASINDPACLWYQWQNNPEAVTQRVVEVIREVQPHVILTFNKYGGYGHPDHIAIQSATTKAFHLAGDSNYITNQSPYQPQRLYYSSIPAFFLRIMLGVMRLQGKDVRHMGTNKDIDFVKIVENIEPNHAQVNIADYLDKWDEASACHKSQGGGGRGWFGGFPKWVRRLLQGNQGFTRVFPEPKADRIDENDLFQNVKLEERVLETV